MDRGGKLSWKEAFAGGPEVLHNDAGGIRVMAQTFEHKEQFGQPSATSDKLGQSATSRKSDGKQGKSRWPQSHSLDIEGNRGAKPSQNKCIADSGIDAGGAFGVASFGVTGIFSGKKNH
jgi:hypothetical protein